MATWRLLPLLVLFYFPVIAEGREEGGGSSRLFGSQTPYTLRNSWPEHVADTAHGEGCTTLAFVLLARHGSRYPSLEKMTAINEALTLGAARHYRHPALAWMETTTSPFRGLEHSARTLNGQGEEELFALGRRLRKKYASLLLHPPYNPNAVQMVSSSSLRASASAVAFGMGVYSSVASSGEPILQPFSLETRQSLRPWEECGSYETERRVRETRWRRWQEEEVFEEISAKVSVRLGLLQQEKMDAKVVGGIWKLCGAEMANFSGGGIVSRLLGTPSCDMFNEEEAGILEWSDDVVDYHLWGPDSTSNCAVAGNLVKEAGAFLGRAAEEAERGEGNTQRNERALLMFSHAETLVPFQCLLGLIGNVHNHFQRRNNTFPPRPPSMREFRTSILAPMGGNLELQLFQCSGEDQNQPRVAAYVNEEPVRLSVCADDDDDAKEDPTCTLTRFQKKIVDVSATLHESLCTSPNSISYAGTADLFLSTAIARMQRYVALCRGWAGKGKKGAVEAVSRTWSWLKKRLSPIILSSTRRAEDEDM